MQGGREGGRLMEGGGKGGRKEILINLIRIIAINKLIFVLMIMVEGGQDQFLGWVYRPGRPRTT